MKRPPIGLFEGYGIELEYMIVCSETYDVLPVADRVMAAAAGEIVSDVECGEIDWSNELVLHVIELKTHAPVETLSGIDRLFLNQVQNINRILNPLGGLLMPTSAHPWMSPADETRLWPHDYSPIYETYNRIFDCRGHGWSNLQCTHINLPFSGDEEFARLHAAIRFLLPIMPALTASSPLLDGRPTGYLDSRMEAYRHNSRRIPSVAGRIIPERVRNRSEYQTLILDPMYRDIDPYDPEKILQHEFLNSRGAIARFDRNAIEIRILDILENPTADIAVASLITSALKGLVQEAFLPMDFLMQWPQDPLVDIFLKIIRKAENAIVDDTRYLRAFGIRNGKSCRAGELWRLIFNRCLGFDKFEESSRRALEFIMEQGTLAGRILSALEGDYRKERIQEVYRNLCDCLNDGRLFDHRKSLG